MAVDAAAVENKMRGEETVKLMRWRYRIFRQADEKRAPPTKMLEIQLRLQMQSSADAVTGKRHPQSRVIDGEGFSKVFIRDDSKDKGMRKLLSTPFPNPHFCFLLIRGCIAVVTQLHRSVTEFEVV
jgi:hypothetical protein